MLYIIISILTDIVTVSSRHDLNQNICEMVSLKMSLKFVHNSTRVAYLPYLAHKMKLIERFDTFYFVHVLSFLPVKILPSTNTAVLVNSKLFYGF